MQLHYIWFNEFSLFKNQGFQMDARRNYEFDVEKGVLTVKRNPFYIQNFFSIADKDSLNQAVISNITAIVGENGAGKSSFLNYIKHFLVKAQNRDVYQALIIMEDEKNNIIILYDDTVIPQLKIKDLDNLLGPHIQIYGKEESSHKIPKSSIIFYSAIFDHNYEEELANYYNLSTNYLARYDQIKRIENSMNAKNQHAIDNHRDEDMNRQIVLVHEYPLHFDTPFPMSLPEQLIVRIRDFDEKNNEKKLGILYPFYTEVNKYVENKIKEIQKFLIHSQPSNELIRIKREIFQYRALQTLIRSFLNELSIFTHNYLLKADDNFIELSSLTDENHSFSSNSKKFFHEMKNRAENHNASQDEEWLTSLIGMVEYFENFSYTIEPLDWTNSAFAIPIQSKSMKESDSYLFLELYRKSYNAYPYLDLQWRDLSSGEKAFLNLMARFYTRADGQHFGSNLDLNQQVLILIDEGDLYFHPEWQRTFIKRLIDFLSVIYRPNRNIQIILSSHSPFFLSDLPSFSVNYLQRVGKETIVTCGLSRDGQSTFAANIHDLFQRSFFMKSTFGEFAQEKINTVIEQLRRLEQKTVDSKKKEDAPLSLISQSENSKELLNIIKMIGEPVLAGKLLDLYYQIFPEKGLEEQTKNQYEHWKQKMERLGLLEDRL